MQSRDLPSDPSAMPINSKNPENTKTHAENNVKNEKNKENFSVTNNNVINNNGVKRERPLRACTQRATAKIQAAVQAISEAGKKKKSAKRREKLAARLIKEDSGEEEESLMDSPCSKIVTQLVGEPEPSQLQRWSIRSMWQLASILDFLNVFRPLLNINVDFSVEEFETALISPNNTLVDIHMPLLKAIPPVTRMALGYGTWVTVLCRKLKDWWHWVAEGDLPIVASHGAEVDAYSSLDPGVRVVILKALCDIRVEQEDIRHYIDDSIKHGVPLSAFRKERIGGESHGISYWYEDDPIIGHRLYREIRKVEAIKVKGKKVSPIPHSSYQWETVATNFEEFQNVSEKLFSSKNRTEVAVGKKLKSNMLPEIEKVHKRKEKLLKKQHRQALMLDSMINLDALAAGRSLRDRKRVTYTYDDYDQSINEAIKVTKIRRPCLQPSDRRDPLVKLEASRNGRLGGPSEDSRNFSSSALSPNSPEDEKVYDYQKNEKLDHSNRRRQRPQRYSVEDFVEAVSDNDADFDSEDYIVGEVIQVEEYLKKRKKISNMSSSSEGEEEYKWDEENLEEEEQEEDESLSTSQESDVPRKTSRVQTRRQTKSKSSNECQTGLRRSKRSTRNTMNYRHYEVSESDTDSLKPDKSTPLDEDSSASGDEDLSMEASEGEIGNLEVPVDPPNVEEINPVPKKIDPPEESNSGNQEVGVKKNTFS